MTPLTDAAHAALAAALETLLQRELGPATSLALDAPVAARRAELQLDDQLVLAGPAGLTVALDAGWLTLLSKARRDAALTPADAEARDFLAGLAAEAYAAVRAALPDADLAAGAFDVRMPGEGLPEGLPETLAATSFRLAPAGLSGVALRPETGAAAPADFPDLGAESWTDAPAGGDGFAGSFDRLADVELEVTVELGRRRLPLADVLRLTPGSVIELQKLVGEPLELYANGRLIAEGEAVVIDDQFGVRITRLVGGRG